MPYSIITGASAGIGKALAEQCAASGYDLILVSLPGEQLYSVGEELTQRYDVSVRCHETDLTVEGAVDDFFGWCRDEGFAIDMLVNNAGIGLQGEFIDSDKEKYQTMMQLNMDVVTSMTWSALPFLKKHSPAYILNVGSIISYLSVPYKALYAATKNFVLTFSNALHFELRNTDIKVSCVCPGPTLTNHKRTRQVRQLGFKAQMLVKDADYVALRALKGLKKGKRTIIPGITNKLIVALAKYLPTDVQLKIAERVFAGSDFNEKHEPDRKESREKQFNVEAE